MVATWKSRYALTTHAMPDTPPRSRTIDGSAVATIVPSIPEIIIPIWSPTKTTTNPGAVESVRAGVLMASGIFLIASGCQSNRRWSRPVEAYGDPGGTGPRRRRRRGRRAGRRVGRRGADPRPAGGPSRDPQPIALRARRRARRTAARPRARFGAHARRRAPLLGDRPV